MTRAAAFALATCYLKHRINVPKFAAAPGQPAASRRKYATRSADVRPLPFPAAVVREWTPETPLGLGQLLGLVCGLTLAPLRWEPRNVSQVHAGIPRPGGMQFCSRLYLSDADGTAHFRYQPEHHALEPIGEHTVDGSEWHLTVVADIGRIAADYGDLALLVALMETGHCLAQIALLCSACGTEAKVAHPSVAVPVESGLQVPVGAVSFRMPAGSANEISADRHRGVIEIPGETANFRDDLREMVWMAEQLKNGGSRIAPRTLAPDPDRFARLIRATRSRSSGYEGGGVVPRPALDAEAFDKLLSQWADLAGGLLSSGPSTPIRLHVASLQVAGREPQVFTLDLASGSRLTGAPSSIDAQLRAWIGLGGGYNVSEYSLAVAMSCDLVKATNRHGAGAYLEIMVEAGMRAQTFLLACAQAGLFARPMRAFREAELERTLGLDRQLIYLVMAGAQRAANPSLTILA